MKRLAFATLLALPLVAGTVRSQPPTPLDTQLIGVFSGPVQLLSPAGDTERLFVVQKGGLIRIRKNGVILGTPFLNISTLVAGGSEQGLLGMAFHPNYAANGFFYLYYTATGTGSIVIRRYTVSANPDVADATSGLTIITIPHPTFGNHNGGTIHFGPDGYLYFATGDGGSGNDPSNNAQNINALLGKMIRLDVDNPGFTPEYGIPAGNPYAGAVAGADPIFMIGLRNPWQWSFDRLTGDLWIGDVGQNAREEIDFVAAADIAVPATPATVKNFGWRCMEGLNCTGLSGCVCNAATLTNPVYTYANSPCFAVIGGYVYRGCAIPDLRGTYFFAEHCSNQIWSFRYVGGAVTNFATRTAELDPPGADSITSITGFGEDACGELYILELGGQVWKIVPTPPAPTTGLLPYGSGTAGCAGLHALNANSPPTNFNPCWKLTCTNAPANGTGIGVLADVPDVVGSDPLGIGVTSHVSASSLFLYFFPASSDAAGNGSTAFSIPNDPSIVGAVLHSQMFWFWPAGPCTPTPFGISSSNGLTITFQP